MKKSIIVLSLIAALSGCGPLPPAGFGVSPAAQPSATSLPATPDDQARRVEAAVIHQLAGNLGLQPEEISIVNNERVQFNDSCLGVEMPDVQCTQAVTAGRVILLEAQGIPFEYHTSAGGVQIQPASIALEWRREGGIAGFCDRLVVFRSGEVQGNQCGAEGGMGTITSLLDAQGRDEFTGWIRRFRRVQLDASDPKGVADRMVVLLSFEGVGSRETVSAAQEQELLQFAGSLFAKLSNQPMTQ